MVLQEMSGRRAGAARSAASDRRRRRRVLVGRRVLLWVLRASVLVGPIMFWEWAVNRGILRQFTFSKPSLIWGQLAEWVADGTMLSNTLVTIQSAVLGYALGAFAGVGIAVLFTVVPKLGRIYDPFMTTLNAVPRFAFAPLLVSLLGFGLVSSVSLVMLVTMFVSFFAVHGGLRSISVDQILWVRSLGASAVEEWRTVRFPAIVRWLLASLRVSVGLAVSAAIVSEFVGGGAQGIGHLVSSSANLFRATGVYAGIVVVLSIATVIDTCLRIAERRWTHWIGNS